MIRTASAKHHLRVSIVLFTGIISGCLLLLSIILFSPSVIGPIGVTLWFVLLMIFLTSLFGLSFYIMQKKEDSSQKLIKSFSSSIRVGFLLAFAITFLLALKSLRSLTFKDVILLILILFLVEIYFRTKSNAR